MKQVSKALCALPSTSFLPCFVCLLLVLDDTDMFNICLSNKNILKNETLFNNVSSCVIGNKFWKLSFPSCHVHASFVWETSKYLLFISSCCRAFNVLSTCEKNIQVLCCFYRDPLNARWNDKNMPFWRAICIKTRKSKDSKVLIGKRWTGIGLFCI